MSGPPVPPHDLEAEESFLGAAMLSNDAVVIGAELLVPQDFYRPNHSLIFTAIMELYRNGQRCDPVTVASAVAEIGDLAKIGGRATLLRLQANTPASANAGNYADVIAERADRRRILQLANELRIAANDLGVPIEVLVDDGKQGLADVHRASAPQIHGDYAEWSRGVSMQESWLVPGILERRDRVILVAVEGSGKLLAVDTPIATPSGWRTMGDLRVGDRVFDDAGNPTSIVAVSDVDSTRPCFEIEFSDGAKIVAADTHLWRTVDYEGRQRGRWDYGVRPTVELAETLHARGGHTVNHAIECCAPLRYGHDMGLPVDPYVLGYWLGNGTRGFGVVTTGGYDGESDTEFVVGRIRAAGYEIKTITEQVRSDGSVALGHSVGVLKLKAGLEELGVKNCRRIPERYLRASYDQRLSLLQGLLDSDGTCGRTTSERKRGNGAATIEWCGTAPLGTDNPFAMDVLDLLLGMGIKATAKASPATLYGKVTSTRTRIMFQTELPVFSLPRKAAHIVPSRTRRANTRYIKAVRAVGTVPCVCIQVAAPSSMYVVGKECIPTHNSFLLRSWALMLACGIHWFTERRMMPGKTLVIDVENSPRQIVRNTNPMYRLAEQRAPGFDPDNFVIIPMTKLDLTRRSDRSEIDSYLAGHRPDLLVIGPLYKILPPPSRNFSYEESALQGINIIDDFRSRYDLAVLIEHHAPKGSGGRRELDPLGSSAWLRWPEFGIKLEADPENVNVMNLGHFRGQRERRPWPKTLEVGGVGNWPWRAPAADRAEDAF